MTQARGPRRLFVDTSGFYASLSRRDANHDRARGVLGQAASDGAKLITTSYVVAECHALCLSRLGGDAARAFLRSFEITAIDIVRPSASDERQARAIIYRYTDKDFSLVDAISFAVMQRLRLTMALSFDADFRQFGFEVDVV